MAKSDFDLEKFGAELSERLKVQAARGPNIKKYKPHAKQAIFHKSKKKGKLYIGGNRSGKSTGGVTEAIWRATCRHPYRPDLNALGPNRGRVVGVDFINGIEKIIFPQYKQWLYPSALRGGSWEDAYDKWTRTLNFSNGSTIEFMSYDQDLDKFAGTSRHWVHFDEEPPKTIFGECKARLIDTDGDWWITMTPVEGITWVYEDLYEGNLSKEDSDVEIIEINMAENPYLNEKAITKFAKGVDADEVMARVQGGFVTKGGRVYKNFDPTVGGLHVLSEPFDEPAKVFDSRNWLWVMGLDHGLNNPTAVLWMAVDQNGFCIVFDEHYRNEWTVDQHAKAIGAKIKLHGRYPDLLVADPSIRNRNAITNTSVWEEYVKYGFVFTDGNNDVKSGIIRVKKYFNSAPYVAKRRNKVFSEGDAFPRLRLTPNCVNTIKELKGYRWKTYANKKLQFENNPYDEPHKKDDHACDALRYMIMTRPDLSATTIETADQVNDMMRAIEQKITVHSDPDYDDPRGLLDPSNPWTFDHSKPSVESEWSYDEHMGGSY